MEIPKLSVKLNVVCLKCELHQPVVKAQYYTVLTFFSRKKKSSSLSGQQIFLRLYNYFAHEEKKCVTLTRKLLGIRRIFRCGSTVCIVELQQVLFAPFAETKKNPSGRYLDLGCPRRCSVAWNRASGNLLQVNLARCAAEDEMT